MTGARTVQCPHCGTMMDERARFCPGCGTPRTVVREQLQRESAATGVPYEQLLERERNAYRAGLSTYDTGLPAPDTAPATPGTGWAAPATVAQRPAEGNRRLWWILGIIGGVVLLVCVGCVVISFALIERFDVNVGDSPEGDAAYRQLQLATAGRHEERWQELHPDQQPFVPIELFATCAQYEDADSIDILGSFGNDNSLVARVGRVDSRVVLYTVENGSTTDTGFVEMVRVDGRWHWTLTLPEINDFEGGRCP